MENDYNYTDDSDLVKSAVMAAMSDDAASEANDYSDAPDEDNVIEDNSPELLRAAMYAAESYSDGGRADFEKDDPRSTASVYANAINPYDLSEDEYKQYMDLAVMLDPTTESKNLTEEISRKMASVDAAESMTDLQLKAMAVNSYDNMTSGQFEQAMRGQPNLADIMSPENVYRRKQLAEREVYNMSRQEERVKINFPDISEYRKGDADMAAKKTDVFTTTKKGYRNPLTGSVNSYLTAYQNTIAPQVAAEKTAAGVNKPDPKAKTLNNIEPPKNSFFRNLIDKTKGLFDKKNKEPVKNNEVFSNRFSSVGSTLLNMPDNNMDMSGNKNGDYGG